MSDPVNGENVVPLPGQGGQVQWADSFVNLLAGLGVQGRDKFSGQTFAFTPLTVVDLENAYRGDWIARKVVTIPAWDMTREWRSWQADPDQIEVLENVEKKLFLQSKMQQALIKSRLYGGAAIIIGVDAGTPEEELNLDDVGQDSLQFIHVVSKQQLRSGPIIRDISSKYFGQPEYYEAVNEPANKNFEQNPPEGSPKPSKEYAGRSVKLHPSRVVKLIGVDTADQMLSDIWGDSVLQPVSDAIKMCGLVTGSLATLVAELKVDVIKIPELKSILSTAAGERKMLARFSAANAAKSVINTIMIDGNEEWQRIQASLAGVPEIIMTYMQAAAGAADIPATRFLGMSPAGLNATGDSDTRNYYDRLAAEQTTVLTPAINTLDEVLIRSALGDRPPEVWYEWRSMWQHTDAEKADIALKKAQTFQIDVNAALLPTTALANGRANQLIEDGTYPGLEAALDDAAVEGDTIEEHNKTPEIDPAMMEQMAAMGGGVDPATGKPMPPKPPPFGGPKKPNFPPMRADGSYEDYDPNQARGPDGKWGPGAFVVRPEGWEAGNDAVGAINRPDHFYRGMTEAEFNATIGAGKGVESTRAYSIPSIEGTSFSNSAEDAESYANYGHSDPRKTGRPSYLIEVKKGENLLPKPDGYFHVHGELPRSQITRVWKMEPKGGAIVAKPLKWSDYDPNQPRDPRGRWGHGGGGGTAAPPDPSNPTKDANGNWRTFHRGVWGPDMHDPEHQGPESWAADPAVARSYADEPNDPLRRAEFEEAGGKLDPRVFEAELHSEKPFVITQNRVPVSEMAERLRLDKDETHDLAADIDVDAAFERHDPKFEAWQYADSKVFGRHLRDRGYDLIASPGSHIDKATGEQRFVEEMRILDPSIVKRKQRDYNPNHGPDGKFSSGSGGSVVGAAAESAQQRALAEYNAKFGEGSEYEKQQAAAEAAFQAMYGKGTSGWKPEARAAAFKALFGPDSPYGKTLNEREALFAASLTRELGPRGSGHTKRRYARDYDPNQPRGPDGKWGEGGAGAAKGERKHPGKGYSQDAYEQDGVIHTPSVDDAARALHEDRKVELDQPDKVSTLIDKLGAKSQEMIDKGEKAPVYNLCNVSVKGTNLFCADSKGYERITMPQLNDRATQQMLDQMKREGYTVENGRVPASHLRATQNELNGAKVAAIARKGEAETKRIVVSKDNYILDGHHHWAAKIGSDYRKGSKTAGSGMRVSKVNASITELLRRAGKYSKGPQGVGDSDHYDPNQPRNRKGEWTKGGGGGGLPHEAKQVPGFSPGEKAAGGDGDLKPTKDGWYDANPHRTVEDALSAAQDAQARLGPIGERIARETGAEFKDPGVKADLERIQEKADERGGVNRVSDLFRGGFKIDRPEQAQAIAKALAKEYGTANEDWKPTPVGYTDKAVSIRDRNGMVGEIQIADKNMWAAKNEGGGHNMYKEAQKLASGVKSGKLSGRNADLANQRIRDLSGKMKDLYTVAKAKSGPGWEKVYR